jgi:hypothetical protein
VKQCQDTGYIFLANDISNDQYLMKTDSAGNVMWTMQYTGGYFINTVEQTADGGYVLAMGNDLIKTDANGVTGCGEIPFTMNASVLTLVTRTPSAFGNFQSLSAAAADSSTSPSVTATLCFPTGSGKFESETNIVIYPNPASTELRIQSRVLGTELKIKTVQIFNILGEEIFQSRVSNLASQIPLNVSDLLPGLYFIKLLTENGTMAAKFVKQ